jgi:hypothetical protein
MKSRKFSLLVTLSLITESLFIGVRSQAAKINGDPNPGAVVNETKQSDTAKPPIAPVQPTAVTQAAQPTKFSFGINEVAKMYQRGVETDVIVNYIEGSRVPYHPSAEEIVRLHDLGVPSQIITTLIRHGAKVQREANAAFQQSLQQPVAAANAAASAYPSSVAQPPPVVTYTYPTYVNNPYPVYVYPGYSYSYCAPFSFYWSSYPRYHGLYASRGYHPGFYRYGFGGHFGFGGRGGFAGGFHGGRHR